MNLLGFFFQKGSFSWTLDGIFESIEWPGNVLRDPLDGSLGLFQESVTS